MVSLGTVLVTGGAGYVGATYLQGLEQSRLPSRGGR